MSCFKYKNPGLTASQCTNDESPSEIVKEGEDRNRISTNQNQQTSNEKNIQAVQTKEIASTSSPNQKDPLIDINDKLLKSNSKRKIKKKITPIFTKPENRQPKKPNKNVPSSTQPSQLLELAKVIVDAQEPPFVLNFIQLVDLLTNVHGSSDAINICLSYTKDLNGLDTMLQHIYSHLNQRSIKTRLTKIRKHIDGISTENESDSSIDYTY